MANIDYQNGFAAGMASNGVVSTGSGTSVKQIPSDWTQADDTKADYIKNKPFYEIAANSKKLIFNTIGEKSATTQGGTFYINDNDVAIDPIFLSDKILYDVTINDVTYENQRLVICGRDPEISYNTYGFGNAYLYAMYRHMVGSIPEDTGEDWCVYFDRHEENRLHYIGRNSIVRDDGTIYIEVKGKVETATSLVSLSEVPSMSQSEITGVGIFNAAQNQIGCCLGNGAVIQLKVDDKIYEGKTYTYHSSESNIPVSWIGNVALAYDVDEVKTNLPGVTFTDTGENFLIVYNGIDEDDVNGDGSDCDKKFTFIIPELEDGNHTFEISILGFEEIKKIDDKYFNDRQDTKASGFMSHAKGIRSKSTGVVSYAEGIDTLSSGEATHSEGANTVASGARSHAEGNSTRALGVGAHSEGLNTTASGDFSHAEGQDTVANAQSSHTEGVGTVASSFAQHVQGRYNVEDTSTKYLHIVGNGENEHSRHNAHTVDWVGNGWFAGKVLARDIVIENADGSNAITSLLDEINELKRQIAALK